MKHWPNFYFQNKKRNTHRRPTIKFSHEYESYSTTKYQVLLVGGRDNSGQLDNTGQTEQIGVCSTITSKTRFELRYHWTVLSVRIPTIPGSPVGLHVGRIYAPPHDRGLCSTTSAAAGAEEKEEEEEEE